MLPRLEYIKQARVRLGITQRKLATLTGISTSMINQIESGRCKPSYETARKIFEVLSSLEGLQFYEGGGYLQSLANFSAKGRKTSQCNRYLAGQLNKPDPGI